MLCAIGENLVSAYLMAKGWPTANANGSIRNFKGIDLFCQHGMNSDEVVGIQVKTSMSTSFLTGITAGNAADRSFLAEKIVGPWIFVEITSLDPLQAQFYILSRNQMRELLLSAQDWYLYKWLRQPTKKLIDSPSTMKLLWLHGKDDHSKYSSTPFINPFPGDIFKNNWSNLWL